MEIRDYDIIYVEKLKNGNWQASLKPENYNFEIGVQDEDQKLCIDMVIKSFSALKKYGDKFVPILLEPEQDWEKFYNSIEGGRENFDYPLLKIPIKYI